VLILPVIFTKGQKLGYEGTIVTKREVGKKRGHWGGAVCQNASTGRIGKDA